MLNGQQLLAVFDDLPRKATLAETGVDELDELTGGLLPGRVWLVTGEVGEGKSTLLTQWAVALAQHGHLVDLVSPREPGYWIAARMLAQLGRMPISDLVHGRGLDAAPERLQHARDELHRLPIRTLSWEGRHLAADVLQETKMRSAAVLVDDADVIGGMTQAWSPSMPSLASSSWLPCPGRSCCEERAIWRSCTPTGRGSPMSSWRSDTAPGVRSRVTPRTTASRRCCAPEKPSSSCTGTGGGPSAR